MSALVVWRIEILLFIRWCIETIMREEWVLVLVMCDIVMVFSTGPINVCLHSCHRHVTNDFNQNDVLILYILIRGLIYPNWFLDDLSSDKGVLNMGITVLTFMIVHCDSKKTSPESPPKRRRYRYCSWSRKNSSNPNSRSKYSMSSTRSEPNTCRSWRRTHGDIWIVC